MSNIVFDHGKDTLVKTIVQRFIIHDTIFLHGLAISWMNHLHFLVQVQELFIQIQVDLAANHTAFIGVKIGIVRHPYLTVSITRQTAVLIHVHAK
jgi:hypothetical protein